MEIENLNILKGKITTVLDRNLINDFKKINTSCIPERLFSISILDDIEYMNKDYDRAELYSLLSEFDLKGDILNRKYSNISKSEYRKISIIIAVLQNNPILLLENPTIGLDIKSKKTLIKILKREKRKNRIIIVVSNDSEFLFQTVNLIICKDKNKYLICDNKYSFFSSKRLLKQFDLEQPRIIEFYSLTRRKTKVRLLNRDNINDLIKEIYRHA